MPGFYPESIPTHQYLNTELKIIAKELEEIALRTDYKITLEEAEMPSNGESADINQCRSECI